MRLTREPAPEEIVNPIIAPFIRAQFAYIMEEARLTKSPEMGMEVAVRILIDERFERGIVDAVERRDLLMLARDTRQDPYDPQYRSDGEVF
jgi:hypothetical protein